MTWTAAGHRNSRRVLASADPRSESPGETLTRELILRLRIRPPEPQLEVSSRAGRIAWTLHGRRKRSPSSSTAKSSTSTTVPRPRCSSRNGAGRRPWLKRAGGSSAWSGRTSFASRNSSTVCFVRWPAAGIPERRMRSGARHPTPQRLEFAGSAPCRRKLTATPRVSGELGGCWLRTCWLRTGPRTAEESRRRSSVRAS